MNTSNDVVIRGAELIPEQIAALESYRAAVADVLEKVEKTIVAAKGLSVRIPGKGAEQ